MDASASHWHGRRVLVTGCTGFRNGTFSELKLNPGVPLWPEVMRQAGYRTCYVGKWHTAGRPSKVGYVECDGLYASGRPVAENYVDFRGRPATGRENARQGATRKTGRAEFRRSLNDAPTWRAGHIIETRLPDDVFPHIRNRRGIARIVGVRCP